MKPLSTPRSRPSADLTSCVWAWPPRRPWASNNVTSHDRLRLWAAVSPAIPPPITATRRLTASPYALVDHFADHFPPVVTIAAARPWHKIRGMSPGHPDPAPAASLLALFADHRLTDKDLTVTVPQDWTSWQGKHGGVIAGLAVGAAAAAHPDAVVKSVTARFSRQLADSPFVFRWAVALGGRVVRTIDVTASQDETPVMAATVTMVADGTGAAGPGWDSRPAPTVELTVYLCADLGAEPGTAPVLGSQRNSSTAGHWSVDDASLWDSAGRLIAQAQQLRRIIGGLAGR